MEILFSIGTDNAGRLSLHVHGDDEPVLIMNLENESNEAFVDAVRRMTIDYCENAG